MKFRLLYSFLSLLFTIGVHAQLNNFTMTVATVNETCSGNGSATLTFQNTTAGSDFLISLYLLPNTTTPLDGDADPLMPGLIAGNYRVIVTETLGSDSTTQQLDFTIQDQLIPLTFNITASTNNACNSNGGILTVDVTSGRPPYFYEIILPVGTAPLQTSNVFTGLASGEYRVRVVSACGNETQDYTLVVSAPILTISATAPAVNVVSCSMGEFVNTVTSNTAISYPLTATYTVYPPGPAGTFVVPYASGPATDLELSTNLPLLSTPYFYDLVIQDSCNSFPLLGNEVDPNPVVTLADERNQCGDKFLIATTLNFSPPYTITFATAPPGFNPQDFYPQHLQPQTASVINYGSDTNPVPEGFYQISITDACNRTQLSAPFEIVNDIDPPAVTGSQINCTSGSGSARITLPDGRKIVTAIMVNAPMGYPQTMPFDVSASIDPNSGILNVGGLIIGSYFFELIDDCGTTYTGTDVAPANVTPFASVQFTDTSRPSCDPNMGSLRLRTPNGDLTQVILTAAPAAFLATLPAGTTLPLDMSANIRSDGFFYVAALPAGNYTFTGVDVCNVQHLPRNVTVVGYDPGVNNYTLDRNCGSFNLTVNDQSNNRNGATYWLQKQNSAGVWEHPDTGVDFTGEFPDADNSIEMTDGNTLLNLTYSGTFRIIKVYQSFSEDAGNTRCTQIYEEFTVSSNLEILGMYTLDCLNGGGSAPVAIYLDVIGVPPYRFRILEIDGQPNVFDNGTNQIFSGLTPQLYLFEVEDSCQRSVTRNVNIGTLLPLAQALPPVPGELLECATPGTTSAEFNLTSLTASIINNQPLENYNISYHESQTAADGDTGAILNPETYTNTSNPQTIYVRVAHKRILLCPKTASFELYIGTPPVLTTPPNVYVCDGGFTTISADPGFDEYLWSTGETSQSIRVTTANTYSVVVKNTYGGSSCDATQSVVVEPSSIARNIEFETADWTDNQNSITILVDGTGEYVYSLDNANFQTSNVFDNLVPGVYHAFIKDLHDCGTADKEVVLLNYPKFFTPNGDGFNEKWQIKFSAFEPKLLVYIFDRYGKLITGFDSNSSGWDGMYNGHRMPSDDYWFMVERENGKVHRGHFTLKR